MEREDIGISAGCYNDNIFVTNNTTYIKNTVYYQLTIVNQ